MAAVDEERIRFIGDILLDENKPLKARFRALFSLRNLPGPLSVSLIGKGFKDSSALLKHELAYCLGQMQERSAIPLLCQVLEDESQEAIVRHEAAEALGAMGAEESVDLLKKYLDCDIKEISDTCRLSLDRIEWLKNNKESSESFLKNAFRSVDPAPPSNETDVAKLEEMLYNDSLTLFERYGAMFALRNLATNESALALAKGLKSNSALFSHEIAFILGQLQNELVVPALIDCLNDLNQNEMVRHECAEALGAIATDECFRVLKEYLNDNKRVVRESCEIALDLCEYEKGNDFQYALT